MPRNRFLLILLAPFVALSVGPLAVGLIIGQSQSLIVAITAIHALAACGDLTGAFLIVAQIPPKAEVRNLGYYTWWRMDRSAEN